MKENNLLKISIAAAIASTFTFSATTFAAVDIVKIDGSSTVYLSPKRSPKNFKRQQASR